MRERVVSVQAGFSGACPGQERERVSFEAKIVRAKVSQRFLLNLTSPALSPGQGA